jgi:hypothetical protein
VCANKEFIKTAGKNAGQQADSVLFCVRETVTDRYTYATK